MATSCSDDVDIDNSSSNEDTVSKSELPLTRSEEDAIAIAIDAASVKASSSSRGGHIAVDGVVGIISKNASRASADTLLYAVNYTDNNGYALIAANPNCDAVLAVTETGHFNSEDDIVNPECKCF